MLTPQLLFIELLPRARQGSNHFILPRHRTKRGVYYYKHHWKISGGLARSGNLPSRTAAVQLALRLLRGKLLVLTSGLHACQLMPSCWSGSILPTHCRTQVFSAPEAVTGYSGQRMLLQDELERSAGHRDGSPGPSLLCRRVAGTWSTEVPPVTAAPSQPVSSPGTGCAGC